MATNYDLTSGTTFVEGMGKLAMMSLSINFANQSVAGATDTVDIFDYTSKMWLLGGHTSVTTAFTTNVDMKIGDGTDDDGLMAAADVDTAGDYTWGGALLAATSGHYKGSAWQAIITFATAAPAAGVAVFRCYGIEMQAAF